MVNVRKISAIAAGALFVGATLGMAAAVTVPSDFSKDMLAKNGEEQAQLVVGANAPGKDADTESANVIKDAVADKLAVTGAGGDIEITYGDQDLDDNSGNNPDLWKYTNNTVFGGQQLDLSDYENKIDPDFVLVETGLLFDANGDGDLKDSDDYTLYDGVWILDGSDGTIKLGYVIDQHWKGDYANTTGGYLAGNAFKLKGKTYALNSVSDFASGEIEIGSAITKKVSDTGTVDPERAVVISGNWKVFYDFNASGNNRGVLYFYDGNSLLDQYSFDTTTFSGPVKLNDDISVGDFEDQYNIFLVKVNTTQDWASMVFVDKDTTVDITDEETDVMGYDSVWVNNSDWNNHVVFWSDVIDLEPDTTVDLEGTYYQLKFTEDKKLDIKRKETKTKASGSKWKASKYDFLNDDITVTVTGGETKTPELEIVDEESADKDNYNLVLIGGPVANTLTADLVTAGKSTVDWYTSEGDIEVIADAFTDGKYAIIVAGKDRDATRAAADALAAAL